MRRVSSTFCSSATSSSLDFPANCASTCASPKKSFESKGGALLISSSSARHLRATSSLARPSTSSPITDGAAERTSSTTKSTCCSCPCSKQRSRKPAKLARRFLDSESTLGATTASRREMRAKYAEKLSVSALLASHAYWKCPVSSPSTRSGRKSPNLSSSLAAQSASERKALFLKMATKRCGSSTITWRSAWGQSTEGVPWT